MQNRRQPQQHLSSTFTSPNLLPDAGQSNLRVPVHRLTFIDSKQGVRRLSAENAAKHRHAIFTEAERLHMSEEILSSLYNRDPDQALQDLDRFELSAKNIAPFALFRGPFGVSKLPESEDISPELEYEESLPPMEEWLTGPNESSPTARDPDQPGFLHDINDIFDEEPVLWDLISSTPKGTDEPIQTLQFPLDLSFMEPDGDTEAWTILSHYRDKVIPLISPFEHGQEVPWRNQVIPCAITTLGETIMNGCSSQACLALLNALLSASSFHLGQHSVMGSERWTATGNSYLKLAQNHLMQCFEEENMSPPRKSKYKEVLMALLSLSTAYMIKGDSEKRLSCLIQAERFISVNGFTQSIVSSKRRALHHCYAYMRIMAETTSMDSLCEDMNNTSISNEESSPAGFRIYPGITFSGDIMAMEKDPSVAQRDLHLAIPGRWSMTLFPKMYGVAESFLMLLSQVIRLANERDLSMTEGREGGLNLKEFWTRAKVLEKGIHLLVSSCRVGNILDHYNGESQFESARAQAMYTALLVFFHRRIYDLEVSLLQKEVDAVRESLARAQEAAERHGGSTATLIWPAFIAACEAASPESELFFSSWFDHCYTNTGLGNVLLAKQVSGMIWARRKETGLDGDPCSWPEILRANKIRLMFI